ncbi:hypothetical protein M5U04_07030 [Xenorhabdus sp. XENO-1]|uniref:hypothetical protein n=1 Tax=Xenorhabdus bovienii TaxID=40576 RepID=UPI0020CA4393|nr:hypothetical protein [Xenorhabdus bovienii]MCP9267860.1 hypothetical protein [Xenorhabdus bovienii subsp. africana]
MSAKGMVEITTVGGLEFKLSSTYVKGALSPVRSYPHSDDTAAPGNSTSASKTSLVALS